MTKTIPVDASFVSVQLPEDHDATKPFPLTIWRDFENPNCWATGDGKKVFRDREWAEKSMEMETEAYKEHWRRRMEFSRLTKAEVTHDRDWVYSDDVSGYQDGYFDSVAELLDYAADDDITPPAYCYGTREETFDFDVEGYLESYLSDHHHEDAHEQIVGWKELHAFMKEWCAKQTVRTYYVDYSKVVVIDQAGYEQALAEARAWLAENASS